MDDILDEATKTDGPHPGTQLADLATTQRGYVGRAQVVALGFNDRQIAHMLRSGRLHELFPGGYSVGHRALDRRGLLTAAVAQAGRENVAVSHISAARGWEMVPASREGRIHISVRNRSDLLVPAGIELHRPRTLDDADVVERYGFPMTSPERTLRDLLAESEVTDITRMLEQMVTVIGRSPDSLHAWAKTLPRVHGKRKLFAALDHVVGPAVLRSELEREFRTLCQAASLPLPQTNVRLGRWEVDALYPEASLVIELDSYRFHGGRWQFNRDRRKGLELAAAGYEVIRLTWAQVKYDHAEVSRLLREILSRRLPSAKA